MSAAEPATPHTPDPAVNHGEGATVIPIRMRRPQRGVPKSFGERKPVDTPTTPGPPVTDGQPRLREAALRLVADDMERVFNAAGQRTLTDDETAAVYAITLGIAEHALKGAMVSGIITEDQQHELAAQFEGLKEAPRLL
ncbi:hypothetical protein ACL07V_37110 [Streptomyces sp. MB22_4]|uniref:hypothetical protein n=1 Tax=Streptomyces sp. MB22_4 TaxID=3383120 RepID=UPI0039A2F448